ncbi:hypothetical protein [Maricaulis parjimensis]|uniref:hypothetical protein n=1 Tax=Maricaulis parjimensis TaxID=144023 RepID=UPI00193A3C5B|nr:hypothetical protein [Maricaulis parjimensis]
MVYKVHHEAGHNASVLTHDGPVDAAEIKASRLDLKSVANAQNAKGALIDILNAQIQAEPVEIIVNVEALVDDLRPGARLAFVSREEDQGVVSMIVTTVAHSSGRRVKAFTDLGEALGWINAAPDR